jgi:L-threonylcarbamoyladenylate synthase
MNYALQKTILTLKKGSLIAYPTEAVYGLGCLANDKKALKKLRSVKQRSANKGFIVLCASIEQLQQSYPGLALSQQQIKTLQTTQTHPTTWLIPFKNRYKNNHSLLLGHNRSLAVRISSHPSVLAICRAAGPIVSSSANVAGAKPAKDMLQLRKRFRLKIQHYLNEPLGKASSPSQIIDLDNGQIIRSA